MSVVQHLQFLNETISLFGQDKFVKHRPWYELSLDILWKAKENVFLLYQADIPVPAELRKILWGASFISSPWPNTKSMSKALSFLESNYHIGRDPHELYVTQGVLTPDIPFIVTHLMSNLRESLGIPMTAAMSTWVSSKHAGLNGLNIVFGNFVETKTFIAEVIKLNFRNYRSNLVAP